MGRWTSTGTIIALVVGAGMLALPSVLSQAGFWNGILQIVLLGLLMMILNLFVGEVVLRTKGKHQLVKLAERYLGLNAKRLMFWGFVIGQYGALIAYLIGINSVLTSFLGPNGQVLSWLLIAGMMFLLLFRLHVVAKVESFLSILMVGIILLLCVFIAPQVRFDNLTIITGAPLVSYGVILFAFMGFTVIPEIAQELGKDKKELYKTVMTAFGIIILLYALFSYSFVGVYGSGVAEVATESLTGFLLPAGAFMTILLFVTSYLAIGVVMKDMFLLDMKFKKRVPWLLTVIVPLAAWVILHPGFITVLSVIGSFTGGITGSLICLMVIKSREKGNRKPEYVVWGSEFLPYFIILVLLGGMAWQLSALL
jgi:amino acid permease